MINPLSEITLRTGGADKAANEKIKTVLNAADRLKISGTIYYISQKGDDSADGKSPQKAWKTLEKLEKCRELLQFGDGVLFERGSVFRQANTVHDELYKNNAVLAVPGVFYGAYGRGPKPAFYGSSFNYAERDWEEVLPNIWKTALPLQDAGIAVLDGDKIGIKKGKLSELNLDREFYHDVDNGVFYFCSEQGNPSAVFHDIEIGCDRPVFLFCGEVGNVTIDNLDIRYVGAHAISGYEYNHHITITNCELAWIGGSWQTRDVVRYGNAVQFWDSCSEITVENCWVHQVYDAGLTFQGPKGAIYKNISFKNNLIQYCNYGIEFFIQGTQSEEGKYKTTGVLESIDFSDNILQFAGYGLCEQRPDKYDSSNICGWATDVGEGVKNFRITGNTLDLSSCQFIYWIWDENEGTTISDNSFYMKKGYLDVAVKYGVAGEVSACNQQELEAAIKKIDSFPRCVRWIDE